MVVLESVWKSLPAHLPFVHDHAIIDRKTKRQCFVEKYLNGTDEFIVRDLSRNIKKVPRNELEKHYFGLIPEEWFHVTKLKYFDDDLSVRETTVSKSADHVFNRWYHVILNGQDVRTTPSVHSTFYQRRIQISVWLARNPKAELLGEYDLTSGPAKKKVLQRE